MFQIIPAIDLLDGQVVRLKRGDYTQATLYSSDPVSTAQQWSFCGRLHLVDLNGARDGRPGNLEQIKNIRQSVQCTLEVGGGLRRREDIKTLLDLGVDKVILGSVALKNKPLTAALLAEFGGKIIIGIDARAGFVAAEGWLETSAVKSLDLISEIEALGGTEIIYTDIEKDGMLSGPNLIAYRELAGRTKLSIIASGGISGIQDVQALKKIPDLAGVIIGRALYENKITEKELKTLA